MNKLPVAVLGATGSVGQRFVQLLENHPWFELVAMTGSDRSQGRPYAEACHWVLTGSMPELAAKMIVRSSEPDHLPVKIAFSALPASRAKEIEPGFANAGICVCSNASAHRWEVDVPLLLPEVNADHLGLVNTQRQNRGWKGCIVTNPNCTSTGLTVTLKALDDAFGISRAVVVSLQAISGAGYPGVASLDILDNAIPNIAGEEKKVEWEPRKMLGKLAGGTVQLADCALSAHTNRVAVSDGHLVCVSAEFKQPADPEQVSQVFLEYQGPEISRGLPSSPYPVIALRTEADRPQPRLDRGMGNGMTTVVGQVRSDPLFHVKYVVLSHNTVRGAAGGSLYNAELLVKMGLV